MAELLFELGCEEIPAEDLFVLPDEWKAIAQSSFEANRLTFSALETHSTPRRLVLSAEIEEVQRELREVKTGPPKKIAVDGGGMPTPAGLGFAKNLGIPFSKLQFVSTPKGEYLSAEVVQKGLPTTSVLKEILPLMVGRLPFRKFMKWGKQNFVFGRPIRNLLALYGGKVIRLRIAGVQSRNVTFGHRFLGAKKIPVLSYEDYRNQLHANGVILDVQERVEKIVRQINEQATAAGGVLRKDQELERIMANEVEFPDVLAGSFPPSFLALPQEILINAMRKHQKYFCATDSQGRLLPVFFTVLNTVPQRAELIRQGHERVLLARLADAEFFWREDSKTTLESRVERLSRLTYHERLGSYAEKIERMSHIAALLLQQLHQEELESRLQTLIRICKTDLLTNMVGEFPELQGQMAGLYARQEGFQESEWIALYDQYKPLTAEDHVPRNFLGALLSLSDRLETLSAGYMLNMIPTGSKDPYALRRIATGFIKIILEYKLELDLDEMIERSLSLFTIKSKLPASEMKKGLLQLLEARFRFLMEQDGIAHDYLNAVLNVEAKSFVAAQQKAKALWELKESEDLRVLARVFKRINNIIYDQPSCSFDEDFLREDGEVRLYRAFNDLEFRVTQLIQERQFQDALQIMVTLGPEIDNFFDEVMVMAEEIQLRQNRIGLLQKISDLCRRLADFSTLQIEL